MSYILDALKKIEREKARKERHSGMANISGELFSEDPSTGSNSNSVAKISIVIILVALVTFGVTWYLFHDTKGRKVPSQQVATSQTSPSSPQVSASPLPLSAAPASPSVPPVASPPTAIPLVAAPPVRSSAPVYGADSEEVDEEEGGQTQGSQSQRSLNTASAVKAQHQNNESMSAPADIKVSGIAWQDERRARRAVVNGFLLHEGSVVSGAKITEIRQDRVRFSQGGRTFEVSLISTGMPLNKD